MKYGIREICDVVLKAKSKMVVGNKIFYKDEPVIYFDSLKTSTMEGAATTVYAQGGRGNSRLVAWEGERTVTFTMEDALISTVGLAILTGADVIEGDGRVSPVHITENVEYDADAGWYVSKKPYMKGNEHTIYGMLLDANGNPDTEPYIFVPEVDGDGNYVTATVNGKTVYCLAQASKAIDGTSPYSGAFPVSGVMLMDYYYETAKMTQIEITPDKFGGNFYLEASTLFRDTNGVDMPAEFIIPNCKVQSNFTFTMASSGDPSTFTFTMDAFPDYTRWNKTKKVLSAIQIIEEDAADNYQRRYTDASEAPADYTDDVISTTIQTPDSVRILGDANVSGDEIGQYVAIAYPSNAAVQLSMLNVDGDVATADANGVQYYNINKKLTTTTFNPKTGELTPGSDEANQMNEDNTEYVGTRIILRAHPLGDADEEITSSEVLVKNAGTVPQD